MHAYRFILVHTHTHTCLSEYDDPGCVTPCHGGVCVCTHTITNTHTHARTHTHTSTHTHAHTHTHTHTHSHTHTHTYTADSPSHARHPLSGPEGESHDNNESYDRCVCVEWNPGKAMNNRNSVTGAMTWEYPPPVWAGISLRPRRNAAGLRRRD